MNRFYVCAKSKGKKNDANSAKRKNQKLRRNERPDRKMDNSILLAGPLFRPLKKKTKKNKYTIMPATGEIGRNKHFRINYHYAHQRFTKKLDSKMATCAQKYRPVKDIGQSF